MKKIAIIFFIISLTATLVFADNAEFRTVVSRNDAAVSGEFHLDLEMRITSGGTSPRTLDAITIDIYYGSQLTAWATAPDDDTWVPSWLLGYTTSANKNSGYYRILIVGGNVGPGKGAGWNVTTSWQRVVTLKWTINETSTVNISIADGTQAASYFNSIGNADENGTTDWTVTNEDLGDVSLPVELSLLEAENRNSRVYINWTTQSEKNNLGFNVYRSNSEKGDYAKINSSLIMGAGNSTTPQNYEFADDKVEAQKTYYYQLENVDQTGSSRFHGPINVFVEQAIPKEFALNQNYPNPFNPETTISYDLPKDTQVKIDIFNVRGELVKELLNTQQNAGTKTLIWDGTLTSGEKAPTGIYFYRIKAESFQAIKKMLLAK